MRNPTVACSAIAIGLLSAVAAPDDAQGQLPPIVFVTRSVSTSENRPNQGAIAWRSQGSRLSVLEADGSVRTLLEDSSAADAPSDVQDPDVSYDGRRIVFSGYLAKESAFRIFEINADGTGLRQLTRSDRSIDLTRHGALAESFVGYDDLDPCYLPYGGICFVSTRYPEAVTEARERATNLFVMQGDGSDLHRITTERYGADTPAVDPISGRIVYSRWWRTPGKASTKGTPVVNPPYYGGDAANAPPANDVRGGSQDDVLAKVSADVLGGIADDSLPGFNLWSLAEINPDGTGLSMFSGFHLDREATHAYRPSFFPDGSALATFLTDVPVQGLPGLDGLRLLRRGPVLPEAVTGPQTFIHRADLPGMDGSRLLVASAAALPNGWLVLSARGSSAGYNVLYAKRGVRAVPALLLADVSGHVLDPVPLIERPLPPVLQPAIRERLSDEVPATAAEAYQKNGSFTFLVENIHQNAPIDTPIPEAPPVGRKLFLEFYTSPQRTGNAMTDPPILLQRIAVGPSGRVETELPAGVPLFEVLRRVDGKIAVGRDGQAFHVGGFNFGQPNTTARCVGCHAGHSMMPVSEEPSWTNLAPSASVSFPSGPLAFSTESGASFKPQWLVDRSTRNEIKRRLEITSLEEPARMNLKFSGRIQARKVLLRGSGDVPVVDGGVQLFWGVRVATYLGGMEQSTLTGRAPTPEGQEFGLDPALEIDELEVSLSGIAYKNGIAQRYTGALLPAFSEIEIIGRPVESERANEIAFLRGDADSDSIISLTDAVTTLGYLFEGNTPPRCVASADFNADGGVAIDDAIFTLEYLFLGGPSPSAPFPTCGSAPEGELPCEVQACS